MKVNGSIDPSKVRNGEIQPAGWRWAKRRLRRCERPWCPRHWRCSTVINCDLDDGSTVGLRYRHCSEHAATFFADVGQTLTELFGGPSAEQERNT